LRGAGLRKRESLLVEAPPPVLADHDAVAVGKNRRTARWMRVVSLLAFAAVVGFWFVALRPAWLGGSATVLTVRGDSMEPTYEYGDVVIAHPSSNYQAGDVIAFRVPEGDIGAGTVVIHRIIGGDATTGFITQGDNNPDPDDWRPLPSDILGAAWWRIPVVGRLMSMLRTVPGIALVAGLLAALLVVLGTETPDRRGKRRSPGAGDDHPDTPLPVATRPVHPEPAPEMVVATVDPLDDIITPPPIGSGEVFPKPVVPDPADDIISLPPLRALPAASDDSEEVVSGEYWGDLDHLAAILRERVRPPALFDDDSEEVARHPV
jgi:signal peptidase